MVFPTDDWLAELAAAAARVDDVDPGLAVTVRHVVRQDDGATRIHRVGVHGGRVSVEVGDGPSSVTVTTDEHAASSLAAGTLDLDAGFMAGRVRIGGDLGALVAVQPALAAVAAAVAGAVEMAAASDGQTSNDPPTRQ